MNILLIVGTRPNFIKITQFPQEVAKYPAINLKILHTGQHHDENMSRVFFRQFGFEPDRFLKLNTNTPNAKTFPVGLFDFTSQFTVDWRGMTAMSVLMIIPAVIFVILTQRRLTEGLTFGAIKG